MKKFLLIIASFFLVFTTSANAIYDPLSVANNKIGVHILFPDEITKAKDLVNTNGGDWGYVTIPIQAGDKDLKKWQHFMDESKRLHIIPIIRLATEGDYFNTTTWRKPTDNDVIDFANFLNSLNWPVKNRYIIVFNEVNRADEWQGEASPGEYAQILSYAVTVFKSKSQDFFIISSGLDNAAITRNGTYDEYDFYRQMDQAVPGIFNQIDGFSSHSYPNPAFKQPPSLNTYQSIHSFLYEKETLEKLSNKSIPIFISETGWDQEIISESVVANYFKEALEDVWNNPEIVAITPFLLKAGPGPFEKFSLIKNNNDKSEAFKTIESLTKTPGTPLRIVSKKVLGSSDESLKLEIKNFSETKVDLREKQLKSVIKWVFFGI